jgi:hypothetical protein
MKTLSSNVLLTGVPRSGTTLTCYLLNKLPDTVALNEPMPVRKLGQFDHHDVICDAIDQFLEKTRSTLLKNGTAISKQVGGQVPDNPFANVYPNFWHQLMNRLQRRRFFGPSAEKGRRLQVTKGEIVIKKQLSSDFLLCIKHPAAFTALLKHLTTRFCCYAIVRNPLPVLASWNSCQMPVRNGHSPTAELFDPNLGHTLTVINDRFTRQLYLLSWYFQRYYDILPLENILRYEDIIASEGKALHTITSCASELHEALENRNKNPLYDRNLVHSLGTTLLKNDGAFWNYYSRASVEQLLEEMTL